ncbi:MAG: hypothetical protein M1814_004503 [Vezdaea aestivalis]|nr:MAG: hypothetical protein M1814_004503 [Vezdaea aestivalis]
MGPFASRKRQKKDQRVTSDPLVPQSDQAGGSSSPLLLANEGQRSPTPLSAAKDRDGGAAAHDTPSRSQQSGTWPRLAKSSPSTQVAKESILASKSSSPRGTTLARLSKPSLGNISSVSNLSTSTETKAQSQVSSIGPDKGNSAVLESSRPNSKGKETQIETSNPEPTNPHLFQNNTIVEPSITQLPASWFSWLHKGSQAPLSDVTPASPPDTASQRKQEGPAKPETTNTTLGIASLAAQSTHVASETIHSTTSCSTPKKRGPETFDENSTRPPGTETQPKTWLGRWSGSSASPRPKGLVSKQGEEEINVSTDTKPNTVSVPHPPTSATNSGADLIEVPSESKNSISPAGVRSSGWAFWSKDTPKRPEVDTVMQGDLVVKPSKVHLGDTPLHQQQVALKVTPARTETPQSSQSGRKGSLEGGIVAGAKSTELQTSGSSTPKVKEVQSSTTQNTPVATNTSKNLLIPSFRDTYHLLEQPSILEQIARLLRYSKQPSVNHVHLAQEPHRIKRALAIGVHGYFPAPLLRTVLGQPTGTSIRFANSAAEAIKKWTVGQDYECQIDKVALEGEGRIAERVDTLFQLMLDWLEHIKQADFILVACHSQGVPVAVMLIAKLFSLGCVQNTRIGICAMAGINLGPFPTYNSRIFSSGTAGELFEFSNPQSTVSQTYEQALRVVLKKGVRILFAGSIDDQLVSLDSSTFSTIGHPYVYRAVFVDGRIHAPDFITHLVSFALKLRNLGISDHGLIRELSGPLAGSLYSGEGHSRIYDDSLCYSLALEHALCSTSLTSETDLQIFPRKVGEKSENPFILPWSMRGLLEEEYVRSELGEETEELLKKFGEWRPSSKALKDVKFRLEAIRSRL